MKSENNKAMEIQELWKNQKKFEQVESEQKVFGLKFQHVSDPDSGKSVCTIRLLVPNVTKFKLKNAKFAICGFYKTNTKTEHLGLVKSSFTYSQLVL